LEKGGWIETVFNVAGKIWTLALMILENNSGLFDVAKMMLNSCNDERVEASVDLTVTNTKNGKEFVFKNKRKVATRFHMLTREDIRISDLTGSDEFGPKDKLSIRLRLTYIEDAGDKKSENEATLRTVNLHVVTQERIENWLEEGKLGLVPQDKVRHSEVDNISFVRCLAHENVDKRDWLCARSEHGDLFVKKCLNDFALLDDFEGISELDGTDLWVTVFREEKKCDEVFDPINKKTIIIFIKLLEPNPKELTYCGHLFAEKDKLFPYLIERISTKANVPDNARFDLYLEREGKLKKITDHLPQHPEGDIGYVIILRKQETENDDVSEEAVKKELEDQMKEPRHHEPRAQPPEPEVPKESEPRGPNAPPSGDEDQASSDVEETKSETDPPHDDSTMTSEGHSRLDNVKTSLLYAWSKMQEWWSRISKSENMNDS